MLQKPSYITSRCLHPVRIDDGSYLHYVDCGYCASCLSKKGAKYSSLGSLELVDCSYPLFCTLTYHTACLDYCLVECIPDFSYSHSGNPRYLCYTYDFEGVQTSSYICYPSELDFYARIHKISKNSFYKHKFYHPFYYHKNELINLQSRINAYEQFFNQCENNSFEQTGRLYFVVPTLRKVDVQNFIKRVRIRLHRCKTGRKVSCPESEQSVLFENVRYILCGEYGPTNGRPHYHVLLFFQSEESRNEIAKNLGSIWKHGITDCRYFHGSGVGYVTNYLSSPGFGIALHGRSHYRQFILHSSKLGESSFRSSANLSREKLPKFSTLFSVDKIIDGKIRSFDLPFSLQSSLFPKCLRFGCSDYRTLRSTYTFAFDSYKQGFSLKQLFDSICKCFDGHITSDYLRYVDVFGKLPIDGYTPYSLKCEKSRIYHNLYISFLFCRNLCHFGLSVYQYINKIIDFYKFKLNLRTKQFHSKCLELCDSYTNFVSSIKFNSFFYHSLYEVHSDFDLKLSVISPPLHDDYIRFWQLYSFDSSKIKKLKSNFYKF